MKDMIERYIYAVVKRLPEESREDVSKELSAAIQDMLPENPTEEEVKKVLFQLGEPRVLANEYNPKKRYLISPVWMNDYLNVLKIVFIVLATIGFVFGTIDGIVNPTSTSGFEVIMEALGQGFEEAWSGLLRAFAIVTIIFFLIERAHERKTSVEFDVNSLPKLPKENEIKISRSGSIVGLVFMVVFGSVFIYLFIKNELFFGWYGSNGSWHVITPLFVMDTLNTFIPFFIASLVLEVGITIVKIVKAKWDLGLLIAHTIQKIFTFVVLAIFFTQTNLFHSDFITELVNLFEISSSDVANYLKMMMYGFTALVGLGTVADLITTWLKVLKRGKITL